jgi:hypothetical protein
MTPINPLRWEDAMQEDMNMMRDILFKIEGSQHPGISPSLLRSLFENYTTEEINYHLKLLKQSNLIDAKQVVNISSGINWRVDGLTPSGHAFVAAAKNNTLWEKSKSFVIDKVGSIAFTYLSQVLLDKAMKLLKGQ